MKIVSKYARRGLIVLLAAILSAGCTLRPAEPGEAEDPVNTTDPIPAVQTDPDPADPGTPFAWETETQD
ncbi:MAG: hypothetical protein II557_11915, partial [Clostridia bacterium]|nr:hypothetical protein [Clostridia bacterium]